MTAQHREMLDQVLNIFELTPDFDLNLMETDQTLSEINSKILTEIKPVFKSFKPDIVLVHGDTATTFATSLAAYYEKITVAHVEAGLRTGNMYSPWPEEGNRKLTGAIASLHFAPTEIAKQNLIKENIDPRKIVVTGNTVIGKGNKIYPFVSINDPQDLKYKGEQTNLVVGDYNKIREYVTINPGTVGGGSKTVIGNNCLFMISSHIAHDCKVGNNVIIANNVPLGGHAIIEDNVVIGGNSAVQQFTRIGKMAMIGGMTGVLHEVIPYGLSTGNRN